MVFMDEKDRIFNPSRQTRYLFARAAEIGPHTKKLCKMLFAEEGRPGQRRMRGIVDLARKFEACHIEQAAQRYHLSGPIGDVQIRDIVEPPAVIRIGLHPDLEALIELIEQVDISRT